MRLTELGYPVISNEAHDKIFGSESLREMTTEERWRTENLLERFGIKVPVDYPENLYNGPLPLPDLKAGNLMDHFNKVAEEQVGKYKKLGDRLSRCDLPKAPTVKDFIYQPGWTRYEWVWGEGEFRKERVPYPLEEAFTFDTETFVYEGAYPIIGTAVSDKACYIWLASELIDLTIKREDWDQFKMIPVGKGRFIAGHNISYDRVRTREAYSLDNTEPENFFFDTLSAHVGVSGLASGQRWLFTLADKSPEDMTSSEKSLLRRSPEWFDKGSTNSLVKCYNFHVCKEQFFSEFEPMDIGEKRIRDVFVVSEYLSEIAAVMDQVVDYAMKDAVYTARLFQALWPKYLDSTPSMVALCGHYHLNGSIVPLVDNWSDWIVEAERVYQEYNNEMTGLCRELLQKTYSEWRAIVESCEDVKEGLEKANEWVSSDPWNRQLDWKIKTFKGKYAKIPNWYRDFVKEPDLHIGVKSKLSHFLLKLKYKGTPLLFEKGMGWCFTDEGGDIAKIPHPKGTGENVGGVLSKDFVQDMEVGRLSSDLPEAKRALEIANAISYWTSVRKRVMNRIVTPAENPYGKDALVTLPEILCHGTVTRRTVENLFVTMCSTKNWRIGTELKTRVVAPEGWKIVGADFDGQEMQVASIYSDKWEGGFIGCSPFGYNVLSGSKESGTDPHTALARAIMPELFVGLTWDKKLGICETINGELTPVSPERKKELSKARDLAKVVGFTTLYGGGAKAIQTYIRKIYPDKTEAEVEQFARTALKTKKGTMDGGLYSGGSDSGCFNFMEEIALRQEVSTLPCLGTKISTAMRKKAVADDFKTGRVNWTIQSSGAEILSIILTSVHWLAKEYKIPCRFVLSIHDEVWFMTPERYAEQFAVLFQIAHVYTWSLFHSRVGIPELPLSRAYFSSVAIDNRIRKSPKECTVSPSNLNGAEEPNGVEHSMTELSEIGAINKLTTRLNAIKSGLI
jgi:DNA polymerase gamma 1